MVCRAQFYFLFPSIITIVFLSNLFQPKVKTKFGQENKLIHPKSRKAEQISREWHRDVRVKHKRKETAIKMSALGEKVAWFRDHLEETAASTAYSPKMIADLIEDYLNRFDEELEQIHIKNQVGKRTSRQHASREDTIQHMKKLEMEEYEGCGFGMHFKPFFEFHHT